MQNDEYYDAYIREWNKTLKGQNRVTEQEKKELHELMEKQKAQKGVDSDGE